MIAGAWVSAAVAAALALAPPADDRQKDGEEKPQESGLEEQVDVHESRPRGEDPAAFHTRIDLEQATSRGEDLADVLRRVPGVRVRDYGGLGSYATISVRASTAEQVTVLVDGVPQNRALGGPVDLSSIPATLIQEIDVFRGFGPADLGLGGIGGVVDVRTKVVGSEPMVQVDLLAGELSTERLSASFSLPTGASSGFRADAERLTSTGNFVYLDTHGTYPYESGSDDRLARRRNNALEESAVQLQHAWNAAGAGQLRVLLRLQDRAQGAPWVDSLETHTARLDESLHDLTASWIRPGTGRIEETRIVWNGFDGESRFADPDNDFKMTPTDRFTRTQGTSLAGVLRASAGRHRLTLRADLGTERARVRDELLDIEDRGGARRNRIALAAEDTLAFGRLVLAPSLRREERRDDFLAGGGGTLSPPAEDVNEAAWSGKLGVAYSLSPRTALRGSAGSFFRSPNLHELFGNRGVLRGNPALRSERGTAGELGLAHRGKRGAVDLEMEAVAFGRLTRDMIHFREQSQGVLVPLNLLDTETHGVETSFRLHSPNGLRIDLAGTWQRSIDRSGGRQDGRPLLFLPEWLGYLGAGFRQSGWDISWDVTYTGENPAEFSDNPALRLPERLIHDVAVSHEWGGGFEATLDVRNLFDRKTVDVARYPLPDRVVLVHVGWRQGTHKP